MVSFKQLILISAIFAVALSTSPTCTGGQVLNVTGDTCVNANTCTRLNLAGTQCVASCTGNYADPASTPAGAQCVCAINFVKDVAGANCVAFNTCPGRLNLAGTQCVAACTGNMVDQSSVAGSQCVCAEGKIANRNVSDCICGGNTPRLNLKGDTCVASCTGNFADPTGATVGSQCVCASGKTANTDKSDCTSASTSSINLQITYLLLVVVFVFFM
ncbi:hypothetical protein ABPG74_014019 [Tetrahymena malaccensis]